MPVYSSSNVETSQMTSPQSRKDWLNKFQRVSPKKENVHGDVMMKTEPDDAYSDNLPSMNNNMMVTPLISPNDETLSPNHNNHLKQSLQSPNNHNSSGSPINNSSNSPGAIIAANHTTITNTSSNYFPYSSQVNIQEIIANSNNSNHHQQTYRQVSVLPGQHPQQQPLGNHLSMHQQQQSQPQTHHVPPPLQSPIESGHNLYNNASDYSISNFSPNFKHEKLQEIINNNISRKNINSHGWSGTIVPQNPEPKSYMFKNKPYRSKKANDSGRRHQNELLSSTSPGGLLKNEENFDQNRLIIDGESCQKDRDEKAFKCGECEFSFKTRGQLRKHLSSEHRVDDNNGEELLNLSRCPVSNCSYSTYKRDEFDEHCKKHSIEGYTPTGKKRSNNKDALRRHRFQKEEFCCPIAMCDYKAVVEKAFRKHMDAHRTNNQEYLAKKFSCQICGEDFLSEDEVRVHSNEHKQGNEFRCDICQFSSVQQKKLIQHRRMHTGEKPHLCIKCEYRAARRDNLR